MEITGEIKVVKDLELFGENEFKKRSVVLSTDEQYPQKLIIDFLQTKAKIVESISVGDNLTISVNIKGSTWTNKMGETRYGTNLIGWKIVKNAKARTQETTGIANTFTDKYVDDDDLPF